METQIKFSDFEIIPIMKSIRKEEIDDKTYFSKTYSRYISNSRLKWIDPEREGTPTLYKNPPRLSTSSLLIGGKVHEILLQPEEFELAPLLGKPTAKLGAVVDMIYELRKKGYKIYDAIHEACTKVSYYVNSIDKKIPFIIEKGLKYYLARKEYDKKKYEKEQIHLSEPDRKTVTGCLESCYANKAIMNKLHPTDMFGDPIDSYCEDALFIDFLVTYKGNRCVTLPFKLKADNWTIDFDNKVVTLNDLKTSGHFVSGFMDPGHSFDNFAYGIQMACYSHVLWYYCEKNFGVCKKQGWKLDANMLVVQTIPPYTSQCFPVSKSQLKQGWNRFEQLMKRVAYYEIFGYKKEVEFV